MLDKLGYMGYIGEQGIGYSVTTTVSSIGTPHNHIRSGVTARQPDSASYEYKGGALMLERLGLLNFRLQTYEAVKVNTYASRDSSDVTVGRKQRGQRIANEYLSDGDGSPADSKAITRPAVAKFYSGGFFATSLSKRAKETRQRHAAISLPTRSNDVPLYRKRRGSSYP